MFNRRSFAWLLILVLLAMMAWVPGFSLLVAAVVTGIPNYVYGIGVIVWGLFYIGLYLRSKGWF